MEQRASDTLQEVMTSGMHAQSILKMTQDILSQTKRIKKGGKPLKKAKIYSEGEPTVLIGLQPEFLSSSIVHTGRKKNQKKNQTKKTFSANGRGGAQTGNTNHH
ncbi:hypothetical protein CHS0354_012625 [Potamilus streckersoni]|uniref:Uncharacterized protein n=1 Tax=Potamilus streckersoni TaxID=2493646 RepID=A0AAE0W3C4_9BIVA|nr:hypothetical protein CHS0354_012625 [Potamilus streckersoni]